MKVVTLKNKTKRAISVGTPVCLNKKGELTFVKKHLTPCRFNVWFKAQFGALPLPISRVLKLDDQIKDLKEKLYQAQLKFQKDNELALKYTAARYSWNIKDKEKK
jgi:hypothetical protein